MMEPSGAAGIGKTRRHADAASAGDYETAMEVLQVAMKDRGKTQKCVAHEIGMNPQSFSRKLVHGGLSAKEFFAAVEAVGMTASFHDKTTGAEITERQPGIIPRVAKVVDKVRYDTYNADALCHTEEKDGWLMELYRDPAGRYFIVHWPVFEDVKPHISPYSEKLALQFQKRHKDRRFPS